MRRQRNKVRCEADRRAQRVVVLQLLREDHEDLWARSELEAEFGDIGTRFIARAIASLQEAGVIELEGDSLSASPAAWRFQETAADRCLTAHRPTRRAAPTCALRAPPEGLEVLVPRPFSSPTFVYAWLCQQRRVRICARIF